MNYPPNVNFRSIGVEETDPHEQAGLINTGVDEEGEIQWLGTSQQWDKYEELTKEYELS